MTFVTVPRKPRPQRSPLPGKIIFALLGGLCLSLLVIGILTGGYQTLFSGRIFPGVTMAGIDLSSLTPAQAAQALQARLTYPQTGQIVFRDGDRVWVANPAELGFVFDASLSVQQAYGVGRQGNLLTNLASQLNAWQGGLDLLPVVIFDERIARQYLEVIAAQIDLPARETDLHLDGTQVVYVPGQTGRSLDMDATLAHLQIQLMDFKDGELPLVIDEQPPVVLEASSQAEMLRQALSQPLTLAIADPQQGDPGPWLVQPADLAAMIMIMGIQTPDGGEYQLVVDAQALDRILGQIAPLVNHSAQNARFYFDDDTRELVLIKDGADGRALDLNGTREAITRAILQGEHTVSLLLSETHPAVGSDATAASLGINSLVSSQTSFFRGSNGDRMQNIKTAAAQFHGLLVPPNSTFSMAQALGDVSLENGYAEALIIYNGRTITGVGGGVCQVSTTLFRVALNGGYPIIERHEHAYRVMYYEQTASGHDSALAGEDATVYVPLVDLKFNNDRSSWLLMETYFNPQTYSLTWKFYSGDDGRIPTVVNHGLQNVVPAPEPSIIENPDLSPGVCIQTDYAADGADIWVSQTVTRNGSELFSDNIYTHYEPWQAVYQFGPGTPNPQGLVAAGLCH